MKKLFTAMLILMSITDSVCAQYDIRYAFHPSGISNDNLERRFWIDMGKGNRLCLELEDEQDMVHFTNIDSLLMVFIADMKPFNDSFSDPLSWHFIDYVIDAGGKKKVRLQSFRPQAASFLLDQAEPASLRLEQDTIQIVLEYPATTGRRHDGIRQDRLSLYLNDYHQLSNYITGGLNEKMRWLQKNIRSYWVREKDHWRSEKDPLITAPHPAGYIAMQRDYLATVIQMNMGNYKNFFAPSFGLGLGFHFNRASGVRNFEITWMPVFTFQTNAQGHLQTYRNEFLNIGISRDWKYPQASPYMLFRPSINFGWLIRRDGELFDKNTFRLFLGQTKLTKNNFTLQPGMFFHDFFKGVTPAINLKIDF